MLIDVSTHKLHIAENSGLSMVRLGKVVSMAHVVQWRTKNS